MTFKNIVNDDAFKLKHDKINANLSIKRLKRLIKFELDCGDNIEIKLYGYEGEMSDNKCLDDYNIINDDITIKYRCITNESTNDDDTKSDTVINGSDADELASVVVLSKNEREHFKQLNDMIKIHKYILSDQYNRDNIEKRAILTNKLKNNITSVKTVLQEHKRVIQSCVDSWCTGYIRDVSVLSKVIKTELNHLKDVNNICLDIIKNDKVIDMYDDDSNDEGKANLNIINDQLNSRDMISYPDKPKILLKDKEFISKLDDHIYFKDQSKSISFKRNKLALMKKFKDRMTIKQIKDKGVYVPTQV